MISVILPTFNRAQTIKMSIESVLCQTYKDIELLIIDDGSTDNTEEVVASFLDPRLKYLKLEKNVGACAARNQGILCACGEYIAFQDSDDVWHREKLQKQIDFLTECHADVVFHAFTRHSLDGNAEVIPASLETGLIGFEDIIPDNKISTITILGKREIIAKERFDETYPRFQDWEFALRLTKRYLVYYDNQILADSYIQEDSITRKEELVQVALSKLFYVMVCRVLEWKQKNIEIANNYESEVEKLRKRIVDLEIENKQLKNGILSAFDYEKIVEKVDSIYCSINNMDYVNQNTRAYWQARRNIDRGFLRSTCVLDQIERQGIKKYINSIVRNRLKETYKEIESAEINLLTYSTLKAGKRVLRRILPHNMKIDLDNYLAGIKREKYEQEIMTSNQSSSLNDVSMFDLPVPIDKPLVTVIVPNYNHEPYLRERLESIYNQTYQNFEVILLDDCSKDNSRNILREYAERYSDKTRVIFNEQNVGRVNLQWEKGISSANGDFIWIAESDDYCELDFLEKILPAFEHESVQIAFARSVFVKEGQQIWTLEEYLHDLKELKWNHPFYETAYNLINKGFAVKNLIPNVSSAVFRRIDKISPQVMEIWKNIRLCGDWLFYVDLIKGGMVYYTNETTNYYRVHDKSTSLDVQRTEQYYVESETISRYIAENYQIDFSVFSNTRNVLLDHYKRNTGNYGSEERFDQLYNLERIQTAAICRKPSVMICVYSILMGGGEIFPIQLANALHAKGVSVTLVNCNYEKTEREVRGKISKSLPVVNLNKLISLRNVTKEYGAEIIHSHHASVDKLISEYVIPDNPNTKHIITLHGMYDTIKNKADLADLLRETNRTCSRFVYIADKNLRVFRDNGIYDSNRFIKLNNGMPRIVATPIPRDLLSIPENAFVLCLVSRALFAKGWMEAVQIVDEANKISEREIHLILVGNGEAYEGILDSGYSKYIHLVGIQQNPSEYFLMADMGFLPSRYSGESFPLVVIESLLCGKPVLASNVGEIRNMLTIDRDNLAGEVFDLDEGSIPIRSVAKTIALIANDAESYMKMKNNASIAADRFDIDRVAQDYLEVYYSVFG